MSYENWKDKIGTFEVMDVQGKKMDFFPALKAKAAALKNGEGLHIIQTFEPVPLYPVLALTNAVGAGRMRQAARELVKAYIHGVESAALDDVFELLAWNQGIGFFSSEIGPSALFQAYKLIKNGEKQGKSREDICSALREKFGEKNPEMQVLNR